MQLSAKRALFISTCIGFDNLKKIRKDIGRKDQEIQELKKMIDKENAKMKAELEAGN